VPCSALNPSAKKKKTLKVVLPTAAGATRTPSQGRSTASCSSSSTGAQFLQPQLLLTCTAEGSPSCYSYSMLHAYKVPTPGCNKLFMLCTLARPGLCDFTSMHTLLLPVTHSALRASLPAPACCWRLTKHPHARWQQTLHACVRASGGLRHFVCITKRCVCCKLCPACCWLWKVSACQVATNSSELVALQPHACYAASCVLSQTSAFVTVCSCLLLAAPAPCTPPLPCCCWPCGPARSAAGC
jgi:hypothetical protein